MSFALARLIASAALIMAIASAYASDGDGNI
jgi:hypothetical protein